MNYLSSKELSKKWGVTQCRIILLAREGRIKGAKKYGKTWVFPENSIKPIDNRTKLGKKEKGNEAFYFRYPIYEYKDVSSFSPPLFDDEITLKAVLEAFYACDFKKADELLGDLPERTKNRYIHITALYCKCMINMTLGKISQFLNYYGQLKEEMQNDFPYKSEMNEYIHELEATIGSDDYYLKFHVQSMLNYHESFMPRLCNLSSLWIALGSKQVTPTDLTAIEINCNFLEMTNNYFDTQAVHINLACAYSIKNMNNECHYHFIKALKLAQKYNMFYTIASMQFYYMPQSLEDALTEFSIDFKTKVLECNRLIYERYIQFTNALQCNSIYKFLKGKDYIYLMYAVQGLTNKEVAKRLNKSIGTIGKNYGEIYSMLGVKNKAEAVKLYHTLISNSYLE